MPALSQVIEQLAAKRRASSQPYYVPGLWTGSADPQAVQVDPFDFYSRRLTEIAKAEPQGVIQGGGGNWSRSAVIYNMLPRFSAAFDHDADGSLSIGANADGWRETGTLLKSIALLPYIRGMGFNVVHLLPIAAVGHDGHKGTLGSPYAIRNPYQLDANLDEPALELNVDELFAAFVEAAHQLGLRVVLEFVLRTGARDSDWICDHPDWFYWIKADIPDRIGRGTGRLNAFGNPTFPLETFDLIQAKVGAEDFTDLPAPSPQYQAMFTQPPRPEQVTLENGRYIGVLDDGTRVRVPGAFADWPPEGNQPPWSDVTYLRMYNHPDFNYMAYNTIRMYDTRLTWPENRNEPLWNAISSVIPYYQNRFGIDGVMIDMGHALPLALKQGIVAKARATNPDFAFWDENFNMTQSSVDEGYNAVMGYWVLCAHESDGLPKIVDGMADGRFPIAFFAAAENHNTLRAAARSGGRSYAHYALALAATLPALPFILSGFELLATEPLNTGIGFSDEQVSYYSDDKLALFSAHALDWCRPDNIVESVRYALGLRLQYRELFEQSDPDTFALGYADNPYLFVYSRRSGDQWISVIANTDQDHEQRGRVILKAHPFRAPGLWGTSDAGLDLYYNTAANVTLSPGYVLIVDGTNLPR
jgi:starch synthase (maltosyl-transferring)